MISCLLGYIWTAPRIPFLAMMRLNFVYGSIPKKRSEVFDAIITPNYAGWLVNALFGLKPTHGDDPKESFASSVIRNLETSLRSWAKRFFASWRLIVFRLRRNCLPDRLIRL